MAKKHIYFVAGFVAGTVAGAWVLKALGSIFKRGPS